MEKQMNSTRYKMDDSTDAIYEHSAKREAVRLLSRAYRARSRDREIARYDSSLN